MGASLSIEEKVQKCAKDGDAAQLQAILQQVQRQGGNLRRYLEFKDYAGATPLVTASAYGNTSCVDVLLRQGANVHHFTLRPEGTTALHEAVSRGHMAIVELLLRCGANPFIENARGLTAIDVAINKSNLPMVRALERMSHFTGTLQLKVPKFMGLGSEWKPRWVVVMPRYSFPGGQEPAFARSLLVAYKAPDQHVPACKVWLDGAIARSVTGSRGSGLLQCALALHRNHAAATGALMTGDPSTGYTMHLRPGDGSAQSAVAMRRFIDIVNSNGRASQPASAQRPARAQPTAPAPLPAPAAAPAVPPVGRPGPEAVRAGDSDEDIARRLQQQYDAEMAAYMRANPGAGQSSGKLASSTSSTPTAATNVHSPSASSTSMGTRPSAPMYPVIDPTAGAAISAPASGTQGAAGASSSTASQWSNLPAATQPPPVPAAAAAPSQPTWSSQAEPVAAAAGRDDDDEAGQCVICLAAPATAGFVHGESVHKCCCRECAQDLKSAQAPTCPMCRQPIQHVIFNFYS